MSPDLLEDLARGEVKGQAPGDFQLERGVKLTDEIAHAWALSRSHWEAFSKSLERIKDKDREPREEAADNHPAIATDAIPDRADNSPEKERDQSPSRSGHSSPKETDQSTNKTGRSSPSKPEINHSQTKLDRRSKTRVKTSPGTSKPKYATTETRGQWMGPLLTSLGYDELTLMSKSDEVGGRTYFISHRAGSGTSNPPVHIVGAFQELDRRSPTGVPRLSPHALVQEYLNRTEHLWGMVTNGLSLRLLRDSALMSRPAYIEFDLEDIFQGEKFAEFALLYRLVHRTRLPRTRDDVHECLLEEYFQQSLEQGGRVREHLREGVERALDILANGFLGHPANSSLLQQINEGEIDPAKYYREQLRLVYRLLFLMVSEERKLVGPADGSNRIYERYYGVSRFRRLASRPPSFERRHCDLWEGLLQTFILFADASRGERLGLRPLNGDLFGDLASCPLYTCKLYNHNLLRAIRNLSIYKAEGLSRRINYAALDVEELGSVYESLLDYQPVFREEDGRRRFKLVPGTERKTTGSYYTRPDLVGRLVRSALEPVIRERLKGLESPALKEKALLTIKVCDPASGSGHFLLAAARRIARELAMVRSEEEHPAPKEFRRAVRDVIRHCVYGVDLNPLAVDLCKLALWLEGHNRDMPLSFLDNHIKCGNSLIGVLDMKVLEEGIPDGAFKPVTGDDKRVASLIRKRNKEAREQRSQLALGFETPLEHHLERLAKKHEALEAIDERSPEDVRRKEEMFTELRSRGTDWWCEWTACNIWTYAFFKKMENASDPAIPTTDRLDAYLRGSGSVTEELPARANAFGHEKKFFHWPIEFPEVFEKGGFDVVLGNPPWEVLQLEEKSFFASRNYEIYGAPTQAEREKLIENLRETDSDLYNLFQREKWFSEAHNRFIRFSKRFELTAVGKINTYSIFAELSREIINNQGRAGILIPTGIATDSTCSKFFRDLVEKESLVSLYDFENRKALFPGVHRSYKFALFTIQAPRKSTSLELAASGDRGMNFAFFLQEVKDLEAEMDDTYRKEKKKVRTFNLTKEDFELLNPNTKTCPVFRTSVDAELTKKIYNIVPVLIDEASGKNAWGIEFRQGLFNMSSDSGLFRAEPAEGLLPLYEAKMIHQYDHRWGTYEVIKGKRRVRDVAISEKKDPRFTITPRYWVPASEVEARLMGKWERKWLLCYRRTARATDVRSAISAIIPFWGAHDKAALMLLKGDFSIQKVCVFISNFNSIALDYVSRQKIGAIQLDFFYVKQLPVLPPEAYTQRDIDFILPRVIELVYTAWDLKPFAEDMGYNGDPFPWDEDRRALLRAELDAYYAKLYGLSREELNYILDPHDVMGEDFPGETFRVLKKNEIKKYGTYRTKELVLSAWDRLGL